MLLFQVLEIAEAALEENVGRVLAVATVALRVLSEHRDTSMESDELINRLTGLPALEPCGTSLTSLAVVEECMEVACLALFNLARGSPENMRVMVVEQDGVGFIVRAMTRFDESEAVQTAACWALYNIAFDDTYQTPISEAGGLDIVVGVMARFPTNHELQEAGCRFFQNWAGKIHKMGATQFKEIQYILIFSVAKYVH